MSRSFLRDAGNPGGIHVLARLAPATNAGSTVHGGAIGDGPGRFEVWNGGNGADSHNGTSGVDTLDGKGGDDIINGLGGNDDITGGSGANSLYGGDNNDVLHVGDGTDLIADGGTGDDTFVFGATGGQVTQLFGGDGTDTIDASAVTSGSWGVAAGSSIEHWIMSDFNEGTTGSSASEVFEMNGGDDILDGGAGNDTMDGGDGTDTAVFTSSAAGVTVSLKDHTATGNGTDTVTNFENVTGSNLNDHITGDNGNNTIAGLAGNDNIDGGKGVDWLYYNTTGASITVNLDLGKATGGAGTDKMKNIENVWGGTAGDTITGSKSGNQLNGNDGNDTLDGGKGDDFLLGENGDDTLMGGDGIDQLTGGAGADHFVFQALLAPSIDNNFITDLETGDFIDLSAIDANVNKNHDQAFKLVASLDGHAGQAAFFFDGTTTQLLLDTDGDGTANFSIYLTGDHHTFANFVL